MNLSESLVLHSTKDFQLEVGTLTIVPEDFRGQAGYRLRNRRTNVVEQEGNSEAEAIRAMYRNQARLEQVLADPAGSNEPDPPKFSIDDLVAGVPHNV